MKTNTVHARASVSGWCIRSFLVCVWFTGVLPPAHAAPPACPALLQHVVPRLQDEKPQDLCQYRGRVLLVVNTASRCGFTSQYEGLEALQQRYRDRGLVVLGFPSNDFGRQEPGSNQEIAEFCDNQFGVRFPMFTKISVKGTLAHPFYQGLARASGTAPGWNFHKYLVGRDGVRVQSFASQVSPSDAALVQAIEQALGSRIATK
jgi:glutathione peroxidase